MKTKQNRDAVNSLPITDDFPTRETKTKLEIIEDKEEVQPRELKFSSLNLPLGPLPGFIKRRVDVGRMTRAQSEALAALTTGLQFNEARLKDGSPIKTEIHAIRWVLEQVGK